MDARQSSESLPTLRRGEPIADESNGNGADKRRNREYDAIVGSCNRQTIVTEPSHCSTGTSTAKTTRPPAAAAAAASTPLPNPNYSPRQHRNRHHWKEPSSAARSTTTKIATRNKIPPYPTSASRKRPAWPVRSSSSSTATPARRSDSPAPIPRESTNSSSRPRHCRRRPRTDGDVTTSNSTFPGTSSPTPNSPPPRTERRTTSSSDRDRPSRKSTRASTARRPIPPIPNCGRRGRPRRGIWVGPCPRASRCRRVRRRT
mmetsp:Transcript_36406/g.76682  ORF Transcript_36406/g.76682 Transcript_36406/m.76682 type:complete len:259 (+) Transcript_36406:263-1039(+)